MFVEYTPEELAVFDKTIRKIDQIDNAIVEHLRLHPWPDDEKADFWHDETLTDEEKRELHHKQHERLLAQWKDTAPPGWLEEWEKLQQERSYLIELQRQEYSAIFKTAEDRAFKEIGTDPAALMKSAKDYVARKVEALIQEADPRTSINDRIHPKDNQVCTSFSTHYILATDDGDWKLDADVVEELIDQGLSRHYKLLADQRDLTGRMFADILREYITNYLDNHSKVLRLPPGTAEEDCHRLVELREPPEELFYINPDYKRSPSAMLQISKLSQKVRPAIRDAVAAGTHNLPVLFNVDVGNGDAEVIISASLNTQGADLTNFELEIQNVISEMLDANNGAKLFVTPAQIYREYAGLNKGERVSPSCEVAVISAVDKGLGVSGSIDFHQQLNKHKNIKRLPGADYQGGKLTGRLIEGRKVENILAGGHIVPVGYVFYDQPLIPLYSRLIRQIADLPKHLLNPTIKKIQAPGAKPKKVKALRKTPENMLLIRQLLRQIERMKKEKTSKKGEYEDRLKYTTIAEAADIELTTKTRRKLISDVDTLCMAWIENGHIKGFERYRSGRADIGIKIRL